MDKKYEHYLASLSKIKWPLIIIASIFMIGFIGYSIIIYGGGLVVDEESLILDTTTTIETKDGKVIGELYRENRYLTTIDDIPIHVQNAFVAIEDIRFYKHSGVDFRSIARAIYKDIIALDKVEGASTITQQLAKNLFLDNEKTWMRKTKEIMAAIYLEREYSKDELLELYLNKIYFGQGIYGIETAAQYFFSKSVKDLTIAEGALLAGLAKGPNGYSPINHPEKSLARRNLVLKTMNKAEMISTEEQLEEQGKTLGLNVKEKKSEPWLDSYLDLVMQEAAREHQLSSQELRRGGYKIIVNINERAQQVAYEQFKEDAYFPGNAEGVQGAFVMMDQVTGEIIAAIGGRDYKLGELNRVTVKRQPGSTMKPLAVYGPAMMEEYDVYSMIPDEKIEYDGYVAQNIDNQYSGTVSIYEALARSKNAPAVWLLNQLGINHSKEYLTKMDLDLTDKDSGLAIALGGLSEGLTPLDMAGSYRAFAHEGKVIQPFSIDRIYSKGQKLIAQSKPVESEVFTTQVAWNITEILSHAVDIGNYHLGGYEKALAGKTGSTQHPHVDSMYKDAWFVGYTPDYVSALWMGYDRSDDEHFLTAGSPYPAGLTERILSEIDRHDALTASFMKPRGVKEVPKPIELPEIEQVDINYVFGGFSLIKGKITWKGSNDNRVVYHIYEAKDGRDERIGEVTGSTEFIIKDVGFLQTGYYYIVPYNPLTKEEGNQSKTVKLSL